MKTEEFEFNEHRDRSIKLTTHSGDRHSGINLGLMQDGIVLLENQVAGYMKLTEIEAKDIKTVAFE